MTALQQEIALANAPGAVQGPTPSYLSDLNAMRALITALSEHDFRAYCINLITVCGDYSGALRASATEQAEAYLKATWRWKEDV